jgi:prepilin-type N-terminal cleavage/methylation domain-containing protein
MNVRPTAGRGRSSDQGFTLVELMVVVMIIAVMTAVALPAIGRFIRNYQIRGAAQAVAGEIQTARAKAINKNVNFGVVFVIVDNQTYRYVIEDDMTNGNNGVRLTPAALLAASPVDPAQVGPARRLPNGITFGTGCTGFAANDSGFRFNRLGAWCDPGSTGCNAVGTGQNLLMNPNAATSTVTGSIGSRICLTQGITGLTRSITVAPGGRVTVQR